MTEGTETITTIHLVWMAVLALLVVVAIVVGVRNKRRRVAAQREVATHAEEAGVAIPPPAADAVDDAPPTPNPLDDVPIAAAVAPDGTTATIAADAQAPDPEPPAPEPPAPEPAAPAPEPSAAEEPLTLIKGLGPKVAARLGELGIDRVGQLAALDASGVTAIDAQMGPFIGRIGRDRWVEQARLLAAGDREGFERAFGKL